MKQLIVLVEGSQASKRMLAPPESQTADLTSHDLAQLCDDGLS